MRRVEPAKVSVAASMGRAGGGEAHRHVAEESLSVLARSRAARCGCTGWVQRARESSQANETLDVAERVAASHSRRMASCISGGI